MSTTSTTISSSTTSSTVSTTSTVSSTSSTISITSTSSTTSSTASTNSTSTTSTTSSTASTNSTSTTSTTWAVGVRLTPDIDLTGLVIDGEFSKSLVDSRLEYSLNGRPIIWEQDIPSGEKLDLIGFDDMGWLSKEIMDALQTLAGVPNAVYHLRYEGSLKTVRFRNEEPPVIYGELLVPRSNTENSDWYKNIRIKLMEI